MHCIRCDGNDIFAVHLATAAARKLALEKSCPVLVEAMSYRRGHHSTSDDSTRYRSLSEIKTWQDSYDPVVRYRRFLEKRGWWDEERDQKMRDSIRMQVLQALEIAEKKPKPPVSELFEDVYSTKPPHLLKQEQELQEHMAKYPEHYTEGH
jgi:2-oxoisovalerate dehydrogenase E1 component alpha subunit